MDNNSGIGKIFLAVVLFCAIAIAASFLLPWKNINWGNLKLLSQETVTVVGEAQSQEKSQIASFNAGVSSVSDDKEKAVSEVNQKVQLIIDAVKTFGISSEDIKTQSLSVYQTQESYYEDGRQKQRPGQWQVNNTIDITLRNVEQASELANLLTKSGATNVYGPNFTLDYSKQANNALLGDAMKNARDKAEKIAAFGGKKLGKVINVVEGYSTPNIYTMMKSQAGGGGAPIEPGSQTVFKSLTVTFGLE
jgi:uncharacterized protein YggE